MELGNKGGGQNTRVELEMLVGYDGNGNFVVANIHHVVLVYVEDRNLRGVVFRSGF